MQTIECANSVLCHQPYTITYYIGDLAELNKGVVDTTEIDDEYYQTSDSYGESFWWVTHGDIR